MDEPLTERLREASKVAYTEDFCLLITRDELVQAADEIERLRNGLEHAVRAAELALFVIRKQDVMPNSSWESGFNADLAVARAARTVPSNA